MARSILVSLCGSALLLGGCGDTVEVVDLANPLESDLLDDTAPEPTLYDPTLEFEGWYGSDNNSEKRFRFDITAYKNEDERRDAERLYASHAAHLSANPGAIASVQTVSTYIKQLDDTIYAGVERAVQSGLQPTLGPKREILLGALDYLAANRSEAADDAIVHAAAALELGNASPTVPADLRSRADALKADFLANPAEAKPIGFYTWSADLRAIWQQDRLLQQPLASSVACALAEAIAADPDREARYVQLCALYAKLTNPLVSSLEIMLPDAGTPACTAHGGQAFLGPSRNPEVDLFKRLYPLGIPSDADLMQDLIDAIRAGDVDLTPLDGDGWYAHKLYALETLLVTDESEERAKIAFMARYKKRLQEAFKTMLTQTRETHVKQVERYRQVGILPMPPVPHPRLEPLATVYARLARSYIFLEMALDTVLGAAVLDAAAAIGASGATSDTLRQRIARARDLAFGLYAVSCQDIGLHPSLDEAGDPTFETLWSTLAAEAEAWLQQLPSDPIAAEDVRVMVPVAYIGDGRWRYWAVIGVRTNLAGYSYIEGMDVSPPDPDKEARVPLPTEQFLEVTSSAEPLTREEFRALCDQHQTADDIRAALEAR